jgi:hypothetical protein
VPGSGEGQSQSNNHYKKWSRTTDQSMPQAA